jgi:hypothetical protein
MSWRTVSVLDPVAPVASVCEPVVLVESLVESAEDEGERPRLCSASITAFITWPWPLCPAGACAVWLLSAPVSLQGEVDCVPCVAKIDDMALVVLEMFMTVPSVEETRSDIGAHPSE